MQQLTRERARADLLRLAASNFSPAFVPQGARTARPCRRSAVLLLFGGDPVSILLVRRSSGSSTHAGQIAFPGGGIEEQDAGDAAHAAVREAHEEAGIAPGSVEVLGTLPEIDIPISNNLVTPVLAWWRSPAPLRADGLEATAAFAVPLSELLAPERRGTSVLRRGERTFNGAAMLLPERFGGDLVWGFTGMVLSGLVDAAGWGAPWDKRQLFQVHPSG